MPEKSCPGSIPIFCTSLQMQPKSQERSTSIACSLESQTQVHILNITTCSALNDKYMLLMSFLVQLIVPLQKLVRCLKMRTHGSAQCQMLVLVCIIWPFMVKKKLCLCLMANLNVMASYEMVGCLGLFQKFSPVRHLWAQGAASAAHVVWCCAGDSLKQKKNWCDDAPAPACSCTHSSSLKSRSLDLIECRYITLELPKPWMSRSLSSGVPWKKCRGAVRWPSACFLSISTPKANQ